MSTFSRADWEARIEPHLSTSLQAVSEAITQAEPVRSWLRDASTQAAEGLARQAGMGARMEGRARMMDDLEEDLPELLEAVSELTAGCGTVELDWRPLQPTLSRLYVDFDRGINVDLFVRLEECAPEAAREALATVAAALPEGQPYPNRPNIATGLVARSGDSVGARVKEHLGEDGGRRRTVVLMPPETSSVENLSGPEATRRLLTLLCPSNPTR